MANTRLRELSEKARKYLLSGSDKSKFNIESLITIEDEIDIEVHEISHKDIEEFFDIYVGKPFSLFVNEKTSKDAINDFLSPYLLREKYVIKELREIRSIKREVINTKQEDEIKLSKLDKNIFKKILYKRKIHKLQDYIDYNNLILSQLKQAEVRRQRWGVDMLIGDFYVVYRGCLYILYFAKQNSLNYLEKNITHTIHDLIVTIDNSIMNYPFKKRKDIKKYIITLLENISEHKLKNVSIKIQTEPSNNTKKYA